MTDFIHVQPAPERRVDFARWAVAQTPKVRTVSTSVFAVPDGLFTEVPEPLMIGATVDGHRYVSPDEDQEAVLLGVATPEGFTGGSLPEQETTAGEPLPELPEESYGPDSTPLDDGSASDRGDSEPERDEEGESFECGICDRDFTTTRGRDAHRRQAHPEA
ncbi:hypothetical protein [Streptomyces sp. A5-4]|uniref:hypothetical protein n=1 Tax=Streptomyces sp. A5-4 TaxID=3384771 RepID=UPI003DA9010C